MNNKDADSRRVHICVTSTHSLAGMSRTLCVCTHTKGQTKIESPVPPETVNQQAAQNQLTFCMKCVRCNGSIQYFFSSTTNANKTQLRRPLKFSVWATPVCRTQTKQARSTKNQFLSLLMHFSCNEFKNGVSFFNLICRCLRGKHND